jgi:hypothetical protein
MKDHDTCRCAALTIGWGCALRDFARAWGLHGPAFWTQVSSLGFETWISSAGTWGSEFLAAHPGENFRHRVSSFAFRSPFRKCACEKVCRAVLVNSRVSAERWSPDRFARVGAYFWICAGLFWFVWQSENLMNEMRLICHRSSPFQARFLLAQSAGDRAMRLCIFAKNKFGFSALSPPTASRSVQSNSCSFPNHSSFLQRRIILSETGN